jgi:heme-degrading monooxygenase HmoA
MYEILWMYEVSTDMRARFEQVYGPSGEWARLFAQADGFVEVVLARADDATNTYVTIDRWRDRQAYEDFQRRFAQSYQELNASLSELSTNQVRIGSFSRVIDG